MKNSIMVSVDPGDCRQSQPFLSHNRLELPVIGSFVFDIYSCLRNQPVSLADGQTELREIVSQNVDI